MRDGAKYFARCNEPDDDLPTVMRYSFMPSSASDLPLFEATAQYARGSADRDYYLNLAGEKGAQFGANELDAETLSLSTSLHIPIGESLAISPSVSFASAKRNSREIMRAGHRRLE